MIVEDLSDKVAAVKKKKKSQKKTIPKSHMVTSPDDLKILSERRIVNKDPNAGEPERKSLSDRMKEKWSTTLYGD